MSGNPIRTVLCVASVEPLKDPALYRKAYLSVTEKRQRKADRYVFEKDKRLCVGAELLLRETLLLSGAGPVIPETEEAEYGKPYLKEHPEIRFNLSHSGNRVLCAVSDREVGCDIEEITRTPNIAMMNRFFYQTEFEKILQAGSPEAQTEMFFRFWTLKESFMKMKGLGMHLEPGTFGILLGKSEPHLIGGEDGPCTVAFREYGTVPGYKCALCIENASEQTELETVDLFRETMG